MSANDKTGVGSGRANYQTPPWLRRHLAAMFAPDYDPAADHGNAMSPIYSTLAGTFERPKRLFGLADEARLRDERDGIAFPWGGRRVVFNPPYASAESACKAEGCTKKRCPKRGWHAEVPLAGIETFAAKAASERNKASVIVGVMPDARDTGWWRDYVEPYAMDWPIGRVAFVDPDTGEEATQPPGGTAIVLWLPDWLNRKAAV